MGSGEWAGRGGRGPGGGGEAKKVRAKEQYAICYGVQKLQFKALTQYKIINHINTFDAT